MTNTILPNYQQISSASATASVYDFTLVRNAIAKAHPMAIQNPNIMASLSYAWDKDTLEKSFFAGLQKTSTNLDIIQAFASKIINQIEDIDPSFAQVIDDSFWTLL